MTIPILANQGEGIKLARPRRSCLSSNGSRPIGWSEIFWRAVAQQAPADDPRDDLGSNSAAGPHRSGFALVAL